MTSAIARIELDDIDEVEREPSDDPRMRLVCSLLDATPTPPDDVDAQVILDSFATMMANRERLIAQVSGPAEGRRSAAIDALISELLGRERAWITALDKAHQRVGIQLRGLRQVRAYRP